MKGRTMECKGLRIGAATLTRLRAIAMLLVATMGIAAGLVVQEVHGAAASPVSELQRGLDFYKGKTIVLIAPSPPGGSFDEWARTVGPAVGIFLHATVNIENTGGAGTIVGEDLMASSNPNGLTIGMINPTSDVTNILTKTPGVNFNPARLPFIAGANRPPNCIDSSATSPYKTFGDVVQSTQPVTELASVNGSDHDGMILLNAAFSINHTLISAYSSPSTVLQGFIRGDGQIMDQAPSLVGSYIESGKARCIIALHPSAPGEAFSDVEKGVPSLEQVAKMFPPKTRAAKAALAALEALYSGTNVIFAAPVAIPTARLAAMRAAFEFAMKNSAVRAQAASLGNSPGWLSGSDCKAVYLHLFKVLEPVIGILG